jgi:TPR repeat protein
LGSCCALLATCAPSNEEACKAAAQSFQKCGKNDEERWGDKQLGLCKKTLDTIAQKDTSEAKDHARSLKKCAQMDDCESAQTCLMILLVDDMRQARELRCAKGEADDCLELGARYLRGEAGVTKDEARAAESFQKACEGGSATGCELYGKMLRDGRGVSKDEAKAEALLAKACGGGAGGACTASGMAAMKNGNPAVAVEWFSKACDANDGMGCASLGAMYLHGKGVDKDLGKAKPLLKKACDLQVAVACEKLEGIDGEARSPASSATASGT